MSAKKIHHIVFLIIVLCCSKVFADNNRIKFEIGADNLHAKLGSTQTNGSGSGTTAKNILSDVRFGFRSTLKYTINEKITVGILGGVRLYDYSKDLSIKVAHDQRNMAARIGGLAEYFIIPNWSIEDQMYYDQQLYYYGSLPIPPGNLIFNTNGVFRNDLGTHMRILDLSWMDLWIGGSFLFMNWGKNIDSGLGFMVDGKIPLFNSGLSLRGAYSWLKFDFVTAREKFELLELGVNYQMEF